MRGLPIRSRPRHVLNEPEVHENRGHHHHHTQPNDWGRLPKKIWGKRRHLHVSSTRQRGQRKAAAAARGTFHPFRHWWH